MNNIAIVFVTLALGFYTISIWSERIQKILKTWMVVLFGVGLVCDIIGTTMMAIISTIPWYRNTHGYCGYLALIIMLVHFVWAILAITKNGRYEKLFNKWSVWAWSVWVIAFVTGTIIGMCR